MLGTETGSSERAMFILPNHWDISAGSVLVLQQIIYWTGVIDSHVLYRTMEKDTFLFSFFWNQHMQSEWLADSLEEPEMTMHFFCWFIFYR